jgi:Fe-S cluster assembly ATP-binding protein
MEITKQSLLRIENLEAGITGQKTSIINNFFLEIKSNEIHVIMGPNGSGKSSLSKIIAGHPDYKHRKGNIIFNKKSLLELSPEERSFEGIFLGFQYPLEIPGVTNQDFLLEIYNAHAKSKGLEQLDPISFYSKLQAKLPLVGMDLDFLKRNINEGFSGGEKKRNEILQMILLEPKLIILDEIDSGVDVDSMIILAKAIQKERPKNSSILLITHYNRVLDYLTPTYVHVMRKGKLVKTGSIELAKEIQLNGFQAY